MTRRATTVTVKDQQALDYATAEAIGTIVVDSPVGVWLDLRQARGARYKVVGMSQVRIHSVDNVTARDDALLMAYGRSYVRSWDRTRTIAHDATVVRAFGQALVQARGESAVIMRHSPEVEIKGGEWIVDGPAGRTDTVEDWLGRFGIVSQDGVTVWLYTESVFNTGQLSATPGHAIRHSELAGGRVYAHRVQIQDLRLEPGNHTLPSFSILVQEGAEVLEPGVIPVDVYGVPVGQYDWARPGVPL